MQAPPPPSEDEFDRLLREVMENPEKVNDPDLDLADLQRLQRRLNPYASRPAPPPGAPPVQRIAVSCTNLRDDYLRRVLVTGLAAFFFQVHEEWRPPAEARRWKPAAAPPAPPPFAPAELVGRLEAALALAREAEAAEGAHASAKAAAAAAAEEAESLEAAKAQAEAFAAEGEAAARAGALLYAATHGLHRLGADATARLRPTVDAAGKQSPELRAELEKAPLPPGPSDLEVPEKVAKGIVEAFLKEWLVFDPRAHVRSAHRPSEAAALAAALAPPPAPAPEHEAALAAIKQAPAGPLAVGALLGDPALARAAAAARAAPEAFAPFLGLPPPAVAAALAVIRSRPHGPAAVGALLGDPGLAAAADAALAAPEAFRAYLAPVPEGDPARKALPPPPQDTFARFDYFLAVNYNRLRDLAEALYPERANYDWAFAPWAVFAAPTPEDADADYQRWRKANESKFVTSVNLVSLGAWTVLGELSGNREKAEFLNKDTQVLEAILKRVQEDREIGGELMRHRVRKLKAANIAEDGPDAAGLGAYKSAQARAGKGLESRGAEKVISGAEMRRLAIAEGDLARARDLEALEEAENTVQRLEELAARGVTLTAEEGAALAAAKREAAAARVAAAVPEGTVQVDMFSVEPDGSFKREAFFVEAEGHESSPPLAPYAAALAGLGPAPAGAGGGAGAGAGARA